MVEKKKDKDYQRAGSKVTLYTVIATFAAVSVFTSGWLIGSGRVQIGSNGLVPRVSSTADVPTSGLEEIYDQLLANYDGEITDETVLDELKEGLVRAANDPFTEYLSAEDTSAFNESLDGTFEGIGAELAKEGNFVVIVAPIKGTPADRAGIQPQDIIYEIDGEPSVDITVTEAVNRIRGPKGETVTLGIIREGEELQVEIVRDTISIASVEWELDGTVGVMTISRFGNDTVELARQAARELKNQGAQQIILDLRANPGGLLDVSVEIASIWLPKGSTVLEEKRDGEVTQTYRTDDAPLLSGLPTIVLINEGSASASEIVAGALKDNDVAQLVGQTSYGKGSVQRLIPLKSGGSLKVTIARWFTPSGKNIDKEGIAPDVDVDRTAEDREADRDPQLERAKTLLN